MTRDRMALHPKTREQYDLFVKRVAAALQPEGVKVVTSCTYRSPAEQDALYAQGRTKPGKKVTKLTGKASRHCHEINGQPAATAFDIMLYSHGMPLNDVSNPHWQTAGQVGESLGLEWGGRWAMQDGCHFQSKDEDVK